MSLNHELADWKHSDDGNKALVFYDEWASNVYYTGEYLYQEPQMPLLIKLGFPQDAKPALVNFLGAEFDNKYKDFRVEYFGINGGSWAGGLDDRPANIVNDPHAFAHIVCQLPDNLSNGVSSLTLTNAWRGRLFMRDSGMYVEHLWDANRRINTRSIYNVGCENDSDLTKTEAQVARLARGLGLFLLSKAGVKSPRKPRMSEAEFLIAGQSAAVALAKAGKLEITVKNLAKQMKKDRETVSICKATYPEAWNTILQKFTEAKAYLKPSASR